MNTRLLASASLLAALVGLAQANLVVNGDFENMPNFGSGISGDSGYTAFVGTAIPGWTIEQGYAATVHNTVLYPTISGKFSINTDGEGFNGRNINMYQDLAATVGQQYKLEFDWKNWFQSSARLDVSIVDLGSNAVLASGNYAYNGQFNHETLSFISSGTNLRLRIQHAPESGFNDNTFIVDNFSVTPVPEPATMIVLAAGVGVVLRRRRN